MKIKTKHFISVSAATCIATIPLVTQAQGWFNPAAGCAESGLSCAPLTNVLFGLMQFLLTILTILGVIGFIISGMIYITAGGAGKADLARHWLTYSIIGMVVGLSGYIIISTIANLLDGNVMM